MSLQYIIDGYNITNHPEFIKLIPKKFLDLRVALIQLIKMSGLVASPNNKCLVVFDGYADLCLDNLEAGNIEVAFSRRLSADERIKRLVELTINRKNIVVVSDDKEIRFFVRSCGAKSMSVEDFLGVQGNKRRPPGKNPAPEAELSYAQMHKINEELKKLWLS
ncbi:MAG: NYN domain-containing protein [Candidatus Omnitrophica bacterium]|nr:NYN domain-containing protein [Candidatus Omnitrophota bacterium]MDD5662386.1 NYN domain-containing protein [Candidatus Omnitrophota bacterium]